MTKPKTFIQRLQNRIRRKLLHLPEDILYTKDLLGNRYPIGNYTYGKPRVISWNEGSVLKIGKYCSIATGVTIFLGSEHRIDWVSTYPFPFLWKEARSIQGHPATKGDVVIGNDVWIGYGATILSGVTIGDGAVIGACSLVAHDIPPYAIAAGNPSRVLRYRFDDDTIRALLKIKWWDWPEDQIRENLHLICSPSVEIFIRKFEKEN